MELIIKVIKNQFNPLLLIFVQNLINLNLKNNSEYLLKEKILINNKKTVNSIQQEKNNTHCQEQF
jgi:hypothetical protein